MTSKLTTCLLAMGMAAGACIDAHAALSPSEIASLKTTLTPMGAIRAANADGSIPAWSGTMPAAPAGARADDEMPDFFATDPVKFTIDASNADQYASKLAPGTMYMLKHYAGYKMNVYPTHRVAIMPQWFYDATYANGATAAIKDDNWLVNAKSGIPFPIPKTGKEAIWNHNVAWLGVQTLAAFGVYIVPPGEAPLLNADTLDQRWWPYADPNYHSGPFFGYYLLAHETTVGPPNRVGEQILAYNATDETVIPQITWQYLVGQRRLRKAPQVTYDGAYPDCGGMVTIDETSLFNGPPDRYKMTILGRVEQYIPYDNNKMYLTSSKNLMGPHFLNPDEIRWELHRVWIVDMTLAPGKRHILPHRRIYLDEDTWNGTTTEDYDANGNLETIAQAFNYVTPMLPGVISNTDVWYNTRGSGYCVAGSITKADRPNEHNVANKSYEPSFFSPNTIAAESIR